MLTENQTEVLDFLGSSATHGGAAVERIDTHSAIVFLAGGLAWKVKRAVQFDYLDFSTVERRRLACQREVEINRRTAPALYRGARPITREADGHLALEGTGAPVDWVVEMERFDQAALFDRLAARGALDLDHCRALAEAVADLHQTAAPRPDAGGRAGLSWVIDGNARGLLEQGASILDPVRCADVIEGSRLALEHHARLLDERRDQGLVRQCHGDLHLRNIVLLGGRPTLFDAIEFDDRLACVDVLYDLAFLLMDLWRRRMPRHANVVLNHYLTCTGDDPGLPLLPLFLACRATVRAKTSATASHVQTDPQARDDLHRAAREYLEMAAGLLRPPRPTLVAVGGLSGSGKSTLALALAPRLGAVPGAVVVRSDETRKRLFGVPRLSRLGPDSYTPDASRRVYGALIERAARVLDAGHAVITDAVFGEADERAAIEAVAAQYQAPFTGLWLDAPEAVLVERVERRTADPSDANATVVRRQVGASERASHAMSWNRIDATPGADVVLARVETLLETRGRDDALV